MAASKTTSAPPDGAAPDPPAAVAETAAPAAADTQTPALADQPAVLGGPGRYQYVGEQPMTFLPQGFPPQTAELGDVCELGWDPGADPRWQPTTAAVTRWPDNDSRAGAPDVHDGVTDVAHTEAEREAILARLGIDPKTVKGA